MNEKVIATHIKGLLTALDLDPDADPELLRTPERVAKLFYEEFNVPQPALVTSLSSYDHLVVLTDHQAWTRCPHHLERVKLWVTLGYLPDKRLLGVSKLARLVDWCCSGLHLQEDVTNLILDRLQGLLHPAGCGCLITGKHLCLSARGPRSTGVIRTSALAGNFREGRVRSEFLRLAHGA